MILLPERFAGLLPGSVAIDLEDPLSRSLYIAGATPRKPLDPLGKGVAWAVSSETGAVIPSAAARDIFDGAGFVATTKNAIQYTGYQLSTLFPISMMVEFVTNSAAIDQGILCIGKPADTDGVGIRCQNATLIMDSPTTAWSEANFLTGNTGKRLVIAFSCAASAGTPTVFVNGVQRTGGSGTLTGTTSTRPVTIGIEPFGAGNSTRWLDGNVGAFAVWNRALDTEELRSITRDPYQLFTSTPSVYFRGAVTKIPSIALTGAGF